MPRIARRAQRGWIYHALNRAVARLPLIQKEGDYEAFERVMGGAHERFPREIFAYCVMPNHWHFVMRPTKGESKVSGVVDWRDRATTVKTPAASALPLTKRLCPT